MISDGNIVDLGKAKKLFEGHQDYITAVVAKDGHLFTASYDGTIRGWDIKSGSTFCQLAGHKDAVRYIFLDGSTVLSGSNDRTAKLWDMETEACITTFNGHRDWVNSVKRFGDSIYTASYDGTLKRWSLVDGEVIRTYEGHTRCVCCMEISRDRIYSGSFDMTIRIWDIEKGTIVNTVSGHEGWVCSLLIHDNTLISSCEDGALRVWDMKSWELKKTLEGHTRTVPLVVVSPNEKSIYSISADGSVREWNIDTYECTRVFKISSTAFAVNETFMFCGAADGKIRQFQLEPSEDGDEAQDDLDKYLGLEGSRSDPEITLEGDQSDVIEHMTPLRASGVTSGSPYVSRGEEVESQRDELEKSVSQTPLRSSNRVRTPLSSNRPAGDRSLTEISFDNITFEESTVGERSMAGDFTTNSLFLSPTSMVASPSAGDGYDPGNSPNRRAGSPNRRAGSPDRRAGSPNRSDVGGTPSGRKSPDKSRFYREKSPLVDRTEQSNQSTHESVLDMSASDIMMRAQNESAASQKSNRSRRSLSPSAQTVVGREYDTSRVTSPLGSKWSKIHAERLAREEQEKWEVAMEARLTKLMEDKTELENALKVLRASKSELHEMCSQIEKEHEEISAEFRPTIVAIREMHTKVKDMRKVEEDEEVEVNVQLQVLEEDAQNLRKQREEFEAGIAGLQEGLRVLQRGMAVDEKVTDYIGGRESITKRLDVAEEQIFEIQRKMDSLQSPTEGLAGEIRTVTERTKAEKVSWENIVSSIKRFNRLHTQVEDLSLSYDTFDSFTQTVSDWKIVTEEIAEKLLRDFDNRMQEREATSTHETPSRILRSLVPPGSPPAETKQISLKRMKDKVIKAKDEALEVLQTTGQEALSTATKFRDDRKAIESEIRQLLQSVTHIIGYFQRTKPVGLSF